MLILAQYRNLGLTPSWDIRIKRFKCLNCFYTISKGFVNSEAEFGEVRFLDQHRNLGLTPISDIRIERFQSLTCFFPI